MNEQEWKDILDRLERDEIGPPDMVWRSADGTDWPAPSSKEKREPILLWPDGREKRVMELRSNELLILANAHSRPGDRHLQKVGDPEIPLESKA